MMTHAFVAVLLLSSLHTTCMRFFFLGWVEGKSELDDGMHKYTDQKKRKPLSLMVSIPCCNLAVQVSILVLVWYNVLPNQRAPNVTVTVSDLTVSLPVSSFLKGSVASVTLLAHRLSMISLPPQWVVACDAPLTLSKVSVIDDGHPSVTVDLSVSFKDDFQWVTMIGSNTCTLYPRFVSHLPQYIHSVEDVLAVLYLFESVKMCACG